MKRGKKISERQIIANYHDDIDRCKNCIFLRTIRRWRKLPDSKGKLWHRPKIEELRCQVHDFIVSANGICKDYRRKE